MPILIRVIILLVTFIVIMLLDDARTIGSVEMCLYALYLAYDIYASKAIRLSQMWVLAFVYIILSDVILTNPIDLWSTRYMIAANNMVLLAYLFTKSKIRVNTEKLQWNFKIANPKTVKVFLFVCYALYIGVFASEAMRAFQGGRIDDATVCEVRSGSEILAPIVSSLGLLLPAMIVFFYKNVEEKYANLKATLLSMPVFIILFMLGSRFPLLFSLLAFLICGEYVNIYNISRKQMMTVLVGGILLVSVTSMMKEIRVYGVGNERHHTSLVQKQEETVFVKVAEKMSPEGIIKMMNLSHTYFKNNYYTMGSSSLFLFYFWVPRFLWPDKPAMLGYWLPRKVQHNLGLWHSASFGFPGEFYADFGIYSLLVTILFGILLKKLDCFVLSNLIYNRPKRILAAMIFPYVFFFVRSLITATMTLMSIMIYIIYISRFYVLHTLRSKKRGRPAEDCDFGRASLCLLSNPSCNYAIRA